MIIHIYSLVSNNIFLTIKAISAHVIKYANYTEVLTYNPTTGDVTINIFIHVLFFFFLIF